LARIRALLRRYYQSEARERGALDFGQLTIHAARRQVELAGKENYLSSPEMDLVLDLANPAGQTLSREFLFNQIYSRTYDGLDRSIDVRISQLRKKLADNSENPTRIKTIWGRGYIFIADAWNG